MKKQIKHLWIDALTSGEYEQGAGTLKTFHDQYCCLGVLCDIYNKETGRGTFDKVFAEKNDVYYFGMEAALSPQVIEWADFSGGSYGDYSEGDIKMGSLASDNDNGQSFMEIAETIEKYF